MLFSRALQSNSTLHIDSYDDYFPPSHEGETAAAATFMMPPPEYLYATPGAALH